MGILMAIKRHQNLISSSGFEGIINTIGI